MSISAIVDEAKDLEKDVIWSMTSNFQIATWWRALHWIIGVPGVVAAAATSVEAVKASNSELLPILAITAAVLSALSTFVNPQRTAREFHNAGVKYHVLRGKLRRFVRIDAAPTADTVALRATLEKLAEEKAHLMESTPHTGGIAYWLAKRSLSSKAERKEHETRLVAAKKQLDQTAREELARSNTAQAD